MPSYPPTTTPLSSETSVTSSILAATLPTPTYGSFGTFTIQTKTLIFSPPSPSSPTPLSILLNTSTWPEWNSFIPKCTFLPTSPNPGPILQKGDLIDFDVFMDGKGLEEGKKRSNGSPEEVTVVEEFVDGEGRKGGRCAWKTVQFPSWLMKGERVLEFVEMKDGKGWEFTSWETFGGPMASVIKLSFGSTLVDRLGDYGRDLKVYMEKGLSGGEEVAVSEG